MDWIILIAALAVAFVIFTWFVQVLKSTVSTALTIAFLVLVLQLLFGIGPADLWSQLQQLLQQFGGGGTAGP